MQADDLSKKPTVNIGAIKTQFEESPEPKIDASKAAKNKKGPRVGKLKVADHFSPVEQGGEAKQKEYVPVIIDKAAFERTVGKFENYVDEEKVGIIFVQAFASNPNFLPIKLSVKYCSFVSR